MNIADKYRAELVEIDAEILSIAAQIKPAQQKLSRLQDAKREKKTALDAAEMTPRVSDHAVIRYLERIYGFDFEKQRAELLTPAVIDAIKMGAKSVKRDGYTLKIAGTTIVTVLD